MTKRICGLSLLLVFLLALLPGVLAAGADTQQRVFDFAALLTESEAAALEEEIAALSGELGVDLAVATTDDNPQSAQEYADDFYDAHGFGVGGDGTGALLLIDMENREYYISTKGQMISRLTDSRIDNILDEMEPDMKAGDYSQAIAIFLDQVRGYVANDPPALPQAGEFDRVFDGAGLFSDGQPAVLQSRIDALCAQKGIDLAVVTADYVGEMTAREYAQQFYQAQGMGKDGALLLLDMDHRDVYIATFGQMASILSGSALDETVAAVIADAEAGGYYQAALTFLSKTEPLVEKAQLRAERTSPGRILLYAGGSVLVGLLVCLLVMARYRSRGKGYTYPFRENGKLELTCREDRFLSERIDRRYSPPPPPPSSGGGHGGGGGSFGGGSSTHTSHSGSTHGGGGRGF